MKKRYPSPLVRLFFLLFLAGGIVPGSAWATHIVGGEMYYDCLGNNQYRITLKVYRDCGPTSQAQYDNPANVSVFDGNNVNILNLSLPFPGATNVPFVATNPCFQAPPNVCVEQAIYQTVVTLPVSAVGHLTMAYQRCCRNNSILNITQPQNTGSTYTETVPPNSQIICNSSPRFTNFPPIALCVGDSLIFDHSATDPDGDSIVYQLCSTYQGADPNNPQPAPTSNPPFDPILFQLPYSPGSPIASNPPITINPQTGLLKVYPNQQGQYVVGVCAMEYRNGVLIGTHSRDFQFNVTVCLSNVHSAFQLPTNLPTNALGQIVSCGDYEMTFTNQSVNGDSYHWDFGVPGITTDVSTAITPTFTYTDTGVYEIMLVANPGFFCADTAYRTLVIKPLIDVDFNDHNPQCLPGNSFNFLGTGVYSDAATFQWNFGASATPATATSLGVNNVQYSTWGDFPVSFTITDNMCTETATDTVRVYGPLTGAWNLGEGVGCVPLTVEFNNTSQTSNLPITYLWNFGDGSQSTAAAPTHVYGSTGTFDVSLTITDLSGCNPNAFLLDEDAVVVNPIPVAGFDFTPQEVSILLANIHYTDESENAMACLYLFGDGTSSNLCNGNHEYMEAGRYPITQIVTNSFNCTDTLIKFVTILPEYGLYIPNVFTPANMDGINELWEVKGIGVKEYHLLVYNRWGERIFETETFKHYWNGRKYNRGDIVPQDVYAYKIWVRDVFGREHQYYGHVTMLR